MLRRRDSPPTVLGDLGRFYAELRVLLVIMVGVCVVVRLLVLAAGAGEGVAARGRLNRLQGDAHEEAVDSAERVYEMAAQRGLPQSHVHIDLGSAPPEGAAAPHARAERDILSSVPMRSTEGPSIALVTLAVLPRDAKREMGAPRVHVDEEREVMRLALDNKLQYSHMHQYPFFFYHNALVNTARPVAWSKILVLMQYLPRHDWLCWMDNDAVVMNMTVQLESFLPRAPAGERYRGPEVIMSQDWNGVNSGVFFIHRSAWSLDFLERVWNAWDDGHDMKHFGVFAEQSAIQAVLAEYEPGEMRERLWMVPMWWFNSLSPTTRVSKDAVVPGGERVMYEPGDFVLHTAGLHVKERVKVFRDAALQVGATNALGEYERADWMFDVALPND